MIKKQIFLMILVLSLVASLMPAITIHASTPQVKVAFGSPDWENSDFENDIIIPDRESLTYVHFPDVQPVIIDNRVFVPIRPVVESERFGGSVKWDEATSTATAICFWGLDWEGEEPTHIVTELVMRPGYASVTRINESTGEVIFTANPEILPRIVNGRFMVPLRTLEYGLYVGDILVWDAQTKTACILGVAG